MKRQSPHVARRFFSFLLPVLVCTGKKEKKWFSGKKRKKATSSNATKIVSFFPLSLCRKSRIILERERISRLFFFEKD